MKYDNNSYCVYYQNYENGIILSNHDFCSAGYPAVLIAIGCLVFACSFAAILYLLILYARYTVMY